MAQLLIDDTVMKYFAPVGLNSRICHAEIKENMGCKSMLDSFIPDTGITCGVH